MPSRISDATIFLNAVRSFQSNKSAVAGLQLQVSTGRRLHSLGDDPGDAAKILSLRRTLERVDQFKRNIDSARAQLEPAESGLASLTNVLIRLRELAVSADIETGQFDKIQPEVEQLYDEVLALANTKVGGRFLYAGYVSDTAPFTKTGNFTAGVTAPPPSIAYSGDGGVSQIDIGEASRIETSLPGDAIFLGDTNSDGTLPDSPRADLFAVISNFRNALQAQDTDAIFGVIGDLDRGIDQVLQTRGVIGARLNRLDLTESQLIDLKTNLIGQKSLLEDVDSIDAITRLANQQNTLEASLAVTSRVLQTSLMDFLR